jgi:chloride channel protein, CIC family
MFRISKLRILPLSESILLGGAALLVGLGTAIGVWAFKALYGALVYLLHGQLGGWLAAIAPWLIVLVPVLGGLLVGWVAGRFIGEERHHGVAGIIEATALAAGLLRYRRLPAKVLASAISIGSGASVGPEDPSVQIGANIGSFLGQKVRLSDERMRTLVAAGVASGIAAAFNAPISGVFFALEIILGEIGGSALGVVVLSAVVAAVFTQAVAGPHPAFAIPAYTFNSPLEFPLYLGLGLLAGPLAALYSHLLYVFKDQFHRLEHWPAWLRMACVGLVVGLVGLALPQVLGVGYDTIEQILNGAPMTVWLLLALALAKLVLTPFNIAGGFWGGLFAPALFTGAALGAAYGEVMRQLLPTLNIAPPAFALAGMAAFLAGAVHAPLTAILLLFEMTNDYRIILPVMFAVVVCLYISRKLQPASVYLLSLQRKGIHLTGGRDVEILEMIGVAEVMQPSKPALRQDMNLSDAAEILQETHHHGLPVVDGHGRLYAILTLQDLERTPVEQWKSTTVGEAGSRDLITAYPDETIGMALRRMGAADIGRLPVVDRQEPDHLVGVLRRSDMIRAYDIALAKREAMRQSGRQVRLDAYTSGAQIIEVIVEAGAPCVSQMMSSIPWPHECLVASLRRGGRTLIPHGSTILMPGDVLLVVTEAGARAEVERLCKA